MALLFTGGRVLTMDPLDRIASSVAMRDGDLIAEEETVSPLEALRTQTINSAAAMFRDHEVSSTEAGKRADLVVLSHDPTLVDPHAIREISVQQTYIDGELKYAV